MARNNAVMTFQDGANNAVMTFQDGADNAVMTFQDGAKQCCYDVLRWRKTMLL